MKRSNDTMKRSNDTMKRSNDTLILGQTMAVPTVGRLGLSDKYANGVTTLILDLSQLGKHWPCLPLDAWM